MSVFTIRYRPGTDLGRRFPATKYPWRSEGFATRDAAEEIRRACPNAEHMEVVEVVPDVA